MHISFDKDIAIFNKNIVKDENLINEDDVFDEIMKIIEETKDKDKLKNRLHYEIMTHFICAHNAHSNQVRVVKKYFEKRFEEAEEEIIEGGNYGWDTMFNLMMEKIAKDLGD